MTFNGYTAQYFTGMYPDPLSEAQWRSFKDSLMPQVQMFWDQADETQLRHFASIMHKYKDSEGRVTISPTRMILRVLPQDLGRIARAPSRADLRQKQIWANGNIVAVILHNELDFMDSEGKLIDERWHKRDGSPGYWANKPNPLSGMSYLEQEAEKMLAAAVNLSGLVPNLVSGAFLSRGRTGDDAPTPGAYTKRELLAPYLYGYNAPAPFNPDMLNPINANGVHDYDFGWWEHDPPLPVGNGLGGYSLRDLTDYAQALAAARVATFANTETFKQMVRYWSSYHHHMLYWDEANTFRTAYSPEQHMEACVGKSKMLIHSRNSEGYQLGERVAMYSPFTFNGTPNEYPAQYIMDTEGTTEIVRVHMMEEGYIE